MDNIGFSKIILLDIYLDDEGFRDRDPLYDLSYIALSLPLF